MEMPRTPDRILLVDDEQEVRAAIRMLLEFDDYQVIEAENGVVALETFQKQLFDLVVTDFRMDRMNGGELAVKIRELAPSMPIIMITGFHDEVSPGVVDVILEKPLSWDKLRAAIKQVLPRPKES